MKRVLLAGLVITALLLSLVGPVVAAPLDNAGPPPRELLLREFIHYRGGADPGGNPGALAALASTATDEDQSYVWEGHHWPDSVVLSPEGVEFWVNPENSGLGADTTANAVAVSAQTWENAPSVWEVKGHYMNFSYMGITSVENSSLKRQTDGTNVITWDRLRPTWIAVTYIWYWSDTLEIVECDMTMNSRLSWATDNSVNAFDVQNIATHEFGHYYMLGDLYDASDAELTMYGYSDEGEMKKRTLGYGDELGTRAIYPGATISGTVTDGSTGDAIKDAVVSASTYTDTTDANGFYSLVELGNATYTVTASADGYEIASETKTVSSDEDNLVVNLALTKEVDTTAPVISEVAASDITASSATITWTTDEASDSLVRYGTDKPLTSEAADTTMVTSHSISLTDLTAETTYYYEVQSTDGSGNTAVDNNDEAYYTFTTVAEPTGLTDMWVKSIIMSLKVAGPWTNALAAVTIVDGTGPVSEATVFGYWKINEEVFPTVSAVTNGNGEVTFRSDKVRNAVSGLTFTFIVTDVTKDGWKYNPELSKETSDSIIVP